MFKTFRISFRLRIAYRVNSILYSLKQLPLLKRWLPGALYASRALKGFALVIALLWEVLTVFLNNGLYLGVCMLLPMQMLLLPVDAFVHIYFFLTIAGALCNCRVFDPTKDKYYAIILMRMDAKNYTIAQHIYTVLRVLVGTESFLLVGIWLLHLPLWLCLLPFGVVGAKTLSVAWSLFRFEKSGFVRNENSPVRLVWGTIALCFLFAYGALPLRVFLPSFVIMASALLSFVLSLFAFGYLLSYRSYRPLAQQLLGQKTAALRVNIDAIKDENFKKNISEDQSITSQKRGYAYFNELFIKRHQRLLWRYAKRIALIALALFLVGGIALYQFPQAHGEVRQLLMTYLPYCIFLVYSFHSGKSVVQAMFRNCDHSMLTYSFYRRKEVILSLFRLRLFDVIRINLLPALVLGIGYASLLFICDPSGLWTCLMVIVCVVGSSILFSIHFLACYYLLQPYNEATETKSSTYGIVMAVTYLICFAFIYLRMDVWLFGTLMIAFSLVYGIVAYLLIGRYAYRTFRLRN